jgi:hypothetical protein
MLMGHLARCAECLHGDDQVKCHKHGSVFWAALLANACHQQQLQAGRALAHTD